MKSYWIMFICYCLFVSRFQTTEMPLSLQSLLRRPRGNIKVGSFPARWIVNDVKCVCGCRFVGNCDCLLCMYFCLRVLSRAQSYAERLRLGLAVMHGEAQCSESDMADGRHSPPPMSSGRTTSGHPGLELPCKTPPLPRHAHTRK